MCSPYRLERCWFLSHRRLSTPVSDAVRYDLLVRWDCAKEHTLKLAHNEIQSGKMAAAAVAKHSVGPGAGIEGA
jgi:hypothetical protein